MPGYVERAKRGDIALLPMIESKEGLENVEAIMSLEHVSGVLIGPADLRFSLGFPPGLDGPEPEFAEALEKIIASAKKHGKLVGTVAIGEEVCRKRAAEGMDYLLTGFDFGAMATGLASDMAAARKGIEASAGQAKV